MTALPGNCILCSKGRVSAILDHEKTRKGSFLMIRRPATTDQLAECFARFQQWRETEPVLYDAASGSWHLFRYAEVLQVLTDTTRFASVETEAEASPGSTSVMALVPPPSQRVRTLLLQTLTPRKLNQLTPRIVERAHTLLDRVRPKGEMDVIGDLAIPLSLSVLAELLGISTTHWPALQQWADALLAGLGQQSVWEEPLRAHPQPPVIQAMHELAAFFTELLERWWRAPHQEQQGDLISTWLSASGDENLVSVSELMAGVRLVVEAGYGPATHLLGNALLCVAAHPHVIGYLRKPPAPIYSTIEEVLRFLPPVWVECRTTTAEVTLGSQHLPARARVCAWIVSANRDAGQFLHPEQFDILRIPNRHLSLRYGMQAKFAGALARLEATTTIPLLLEQCAELKWAADCPEAMVESPTVVGVKRLPITFVPRPSSA